MSGFKLTPDALNDMLDIARYTEHQWGKKQRDLYLQELDHYRITECLQWI